MPPPAHTISQADATLANWICASLALAILLLRLSAHCCANRRFDKPACVVIASIVLLVPRTICNALILQYGTASALTPGPEPMQLSNARVGSILTLVARVLVTTYYSLQSALLLLFYRHMLDHLSWTSRAIKLVWLFLGLSYTAVLLATFLECRPIRLYWTPQSPDPKCLRAYVQILLQCIANAAVDVLLLIISLPILQAQARAFPRNLQLGVLYLLGTFCIIVIGFRVPYIYRDGSVQQSRSFWASIQVIAATFVANAPSIYGDVKNVKRRRSIVVASLARIRSAPDATWPLDRMPSRPPKEWRTIVMPVDAQKPDTRRMEFEEPP